MSTVIATDKQVFKLELDVNVYSLEVCKKACYALMNYISCQLASSESHITITASINGDYTEDVDQMKALLFDELLDYSLRESISSQTENLRNIILSNAFSNTKLIS
jgi:His-Xaa-Ser system protein HxsD